MAPGRFWAPPALLLLGWPTLTSGAPFAPKLLEPGHPAKAATCVVDVGQAVFSLGETANAINAAVTNCKPSEDKHDKAACSADIGATIATLLYVVSFTSLSFTDCVNRSNLEAQCAGDLSGFLNAFATAVASGSGLGAGKCDYLTNGLPPGVHLPPPPRKLQEKEPADALARRSYVERLPEYARYKAAMKRLPKIANQLPEYKQYRFMQNGTQDFSDTIKQIHEQHEKDQARSGEIAGCFFDVGNLAWWLMRASLAITAAVDSCEPSTQESDKGKMLCTVQVAGAMGSLAYVAQYALLITSQCPVEDHIKAQCGVDITGVITVFTSIAAGGAALPLSCGTLNTRAEDPAVPNRRLEFTGPVPPDVLV